MERTFLTGQPHVRNAMIKPSTNMFKDSFIMEPSKIITGNPGKTMKTSPTNRISFSNNPPLYPAIRPRVAPITNPTTEPVTPMMIEFLIAWVISQKTS